MLPLYLTPIFSLTLDFHGFCIQIMAENSLTKSKYFQELIEHDINRVVIMILCMLHVYDKLGN